MAQSKRPPRPDFLELAKQGKIQEARDALEEAKRRARNEPNQMISGKDGKVVFKRCGRIVEQGEDGEWHEVTKPARRSR